MGDKTELVVKSAIYTTYGPFGRVDRCDREQSVAGSGHVRTWATPDPGASEPVRRAIISQAYRPASLSQMAFGFSQDSASGQTQ